MGFYIRKAVKVGPLRFNLSKSGIGVSGGFPGFRVGSGPRGNYIHMGRKGLYYRKSLKSLGESQKPKRRQAHEEKVPTGPDPTVGPYKEIESTSVLEMKDANAIELINEINEKLNRRRISPFILLASVFGIILAVSSDIPNFAILIAFIFASVLSYLASLWDDLKRSVVLMYDFDKEQENAYNNLHDDFAGLSDADRLWLIEGASNILNSKYHGGANHAITRKLARSIKKSPDPIKANIEIPVLDAGLQKLAFLPDRLLVFEKKSVGSVSYEDLQIDIERTKMLEEEKVPADAEIVGYSWRYVNKSGGPDRRFKDNPEIPIVMYEEIHFFSSSGLNELFKVSKLATGKAFAASITNLAKII